jgi:hypothetical protein
MARRALLSDTPSARGGERQAVHTGMSIYLIRSSGFRADMQFNQGKDDIQWEKSLLGADVASVASAISLGWYEAILGRYFRNKANRALLARWLS